jgi:hypothetical protein
LIIVKLIGGLGNQMFQYALGRKLSIHNNTRLKVDVTELLDRSPKDYVFRDFKLNVFDTEVEFATPKDLDKFFLHFDTRYRRLTGRIGRKLTGHQLFFEKGNFFMPEVLQAPGNSYLSGYWQTWKYFDDIDPVLRKDFRIKAPLQDAALQSAAAIRQSDAVSLHVRRGDYVTNKGASEFLGVCSPGYYRNAVEYISKRVRQPHFFIFSDDVQWVKANMHFDHPYTIVAGHPDHVDLQLMSICKHNIIANSSFSWWGAWLNANPGKLVVCPLRWFNDQTIDPAYMIPNGWHKAGD